MTVNLVLAAVPVLLALWLFLTPGARGPRWWIGLGMFVAFLPNAPYVLTDVVHLRGNLAYATSNLHAAAIVVQFAALMSLGLLFYGTALALVRRYLALAGRAGWRWP